MNGRSEFKVKINRLAISEIADMALVPVTQDQVTFMCDAPYKDLQTAQVLFGLIEYLKARKCEPDFEVVLNE